MRFPSALALVFALATASAVVGQEPELPVGVPTALADRVRGEVAVRWNVPAEMVVLEVGTPRRGRPLHAQGEFTLVGSGSGGHWVLRAAAADGGEEESVRVRAGTWVKSRVAARRIDRGEALAVSDMRETLSIRWAEPHAERTQVVEGWVAQRLIREGEVLSEPAVQPPLAVRSGDDVELVWTRGGVGVRAPGRAAGSAPVGQQVFVRTTSGTRLMGVVVAPGLVNVTQGGTER